MSSVYAQHVILWIPGGSGLHNDEVYKDTGVRPSVQGKGEESHFISHEVNLTDHASYESILV